MALRHGFTRYAFSIQYHGSSFLGFSHLGNQENTILNNGTDLRGYRSIESRLRQALEEMVAASSSSSSSSGIEHMQVSSRTDRGVHALKNTCQVDIRWRAGGNDVCWQPHELLKGWNHFLAVQGTEDVQTENTTRATTNHPYRIRRRGQRKLDSWSHHYPMNELRILNIIKAPKTIVNEYSHTIDPTQPAEVEWNIRFSAKQRTYVYRILVSPPEGDMANWALPFEWDRSWRVVPTKQQQQHEQGLNVQAMKEAAQYLLGTHDMSSFRAAGCQRKSPVVTLHNVKVTSQPYGETLLLGEAAGGLLGLGDGGGSSSSSDNNNKATQLQPHLVTIQFTGNSFVYHQVRNMVGTLVAVGRERIAPKDIQNILEARDRGQAPPTAPAHGLFLVDVKHDDIHL